MMLSGFSSKDLSQGLLPCRIDLHSRVASHVPLYILSGRERALIQVPFYDILRGTRSYILPFFLR